MPPNEEQEPMAMVADVLNEHDVTTRRGGKWYAFSVREVLLNEDKYCGGKRADSDVRWPVILE